MAQSKTFKHFLELPSEVRTVLFDEMNAGDRCRMTRCSKLCNREAKESRKYIKGLALIADNDYDLQFLVIYEMGLEKPTGYRLDFKTDTETEKKCIKYFELELGEVSTEELWKTDLEDATDMLELMNQHFTEKLHAFHDKIETLALCSVQPPIAFHLDVESLKNLTYLEVHAPCDVPQILSLTRKNLEHLCVAEEVDLAECEKIYQVSQHFYSKHTKLNVEQMKRLCAEDVHIHIGELTEQNIHDFIKSWQDGSIGRKLHEYLWLLIGSKFDFQVFRGLFKDATDEGQSLLIKNKNGESAEVSFFTACYLKFTVI